MEADQKKRQEKAEKEKAEGPGPDFSFRPPLSKKVPDFKRLHKEFAAKMERNKSAQKLTVPKAFNFHEPKLDPALRKHLDHDN